MTWYKTGTVAVTDGSNAVIGTGTSFIANSRVGDAFRGPDGEWYEVTNIASDTALSIAPNYQGATVAAGGYSLAPMQGYVKDSADALRSIVNQYGTKLAALGTTGNYDILPVSKGGTGASTPPTALAALGGLPANGGDFSPKLTSLGVSGVPSPATPGAYSGWNGQWGGLSGENNYINNRGLGSGGFAWVSVDAKNTVAGPVMTYLADGTLQVPTALKVPVITGLTTALSIAQGGTGGATQTAARTALGIGPAQAVQFASLELFGDTPFIDFHYNNTASDYDVRLINDVSGTLTCLGNFAPKSILGRPGINGAATVSRHNFNWTGSALEAWVDTTCVGNVSLIASDHRIKRDIETLDAPFLDRIDAYRVVTYGKKDFSVWSDDGRLHQGLIAHEAQAVNPLAQLGRRMQ